MSNVDWTQLQHLFHQARARVAGGLPPDLTRLAGGSPTLAGELRGLLHHAGPEADDADEGRADDSDAALFDSDPRTGAAGDPLRSMRPAGLPADWGTSAVGQRVGDFTLLRPIGAGGMGMVFLAEQDRPRRTVALKVVRPSVAAGPVLARFEQEAHLLGRLNHPGIAQVFAAGVAALASRNGGSGGGGGTVPVPYIAMELVDGPDLAAFVRGAGRDPRVVLDLVAQAGDAVQHAHARGVIHRDLKPANILVATDERGRPAAKVVDFGVGRLTAAADPDSDSNANAGLPATASAGGPACPCPPAATRYTGPVGTLAYMAPEQAAGRDVDARCDVYALGAVLYHALAGRHPVDVAGCDLAAAADRIARVEPAPLGAVDRRFRGDAEAVVAKALAKRPDDRYRSPGELSADVRRLLAGEPVEARREALLPLLRRRATRYRRLLVAAAAAAAVTSAVAAYAVRQQQLEAAASRRATAAGRAADVARGRADAAAATLARELSAARVAQGRLLADAGEMVAAERLLWDEHLRHPDLLAAEWGLRELYRRSGCVATVRAHATECGAIAVVDGGRRFVTGAAADPALRVWSLPDARPAASVDTGMPGVRAVAAFGPGAVVAVGPGGTAVVRLDGSDGAGGDGDGRHALLDAAPANAVAVVDDRWVAVAGADGAVRVIDVAGRRVVARLSPPARPPATWSAALRGGAARLLAATRPAGSDAAGIIPADPLPAARGVAHSPAAGLLAASWDDGRAALWTVATDSGGGGGGAAVRLVPGPPLAGHPRGGCPAVAFDRAGTRLATGGADGTVRVWDPADGSLRRTVRTNDGTARAVAFNPADGTLVVCGYWRTQRLDAATGTFLDHGGEGGGGEGPAASAGQTAPAARAAPLTDGAGFAAAFTADGRYLVSAGTRGVVRVWSAAAFAPAVLAPPGSPVRDLAAVVAAGGGGRLFVARADGTLDALDRPAAGGLWAAAYSRRLGTSLAGVTASADGTVLVASHPDGTIDALDPATAGVRQRLRVPAGAAAVLRVSADGTTLAAAGDDPDVRVWTRPAGGDGVWRPVPSLRAGGETLGATLAPDGRRLVTTGRPDRLGIWSLPDGHCLRDARVSWTPWSPALSPDGRLLAAGTWGRTVDLWVLDALAAGGTGRAAVLAGHAQLPVAEAFDLTGRLLASASFDGTIMLWDVAGVGPAAAGEADGTPSAGLRLLATFDARAGAATRVAFLPGGAVAAGYADGAVRAWNLHATDQALASQEAYQRAPRPAP